MMKHTISLLYFVALLLLVAPTANADEDGFVSLFDGKTLDGWVQRGGKALYSIEDGAIVGRSVPKTPNSFLCTDRDYGDFILEYDFKVDPRLNSGVQIRSQSLKEYKNGRVHGYQVEIDPSKRSWSGGIYDEGRRGWLFRLKDNKAARKAFQQNEWNHMRVEAVGDSIKTWINGVEASDLKDSMTPSGFIALQVHSVGKRTDPLEVRWRNLRIKEINKDQEACEKFTPLFDGKTLDGWHALPGGIWEVKDGVIVGTSKKSEKRHSILVSDKTYDDFTVRLKFRALKGNSGLYFRSEKVDHPYGVAGFQAEIADKGHIGGLYETAGRAWVIKPKMEEVKKYFKLRKWNEMTVDAQGGDITVYVNGQKTAELKDDPGRRSGLLGLQLHGGQDMHVEFKDIEICPR